MTRETTVQLGELNEFYLTQTRAQLQRLRGVELVFSAAGPLLHAGPYGMLSPPPGSLGF